MTKAFQMRHCWQRMVLHKQKSGWLMWGSLKGCACAEFAGDLTAQPPLGWWSRVEISGLAAPSSSFEPPNIQALNITNESRSYLRKQHVNWIKHTVKYRLCTSPWRLCHWFQSRWDLAKLLRKRGGLWEPTLCKQPPQGSRWNFKRKRSCSRLIIQE